MASINATTSSGIIATADNTGTLQLQSAGTTIANVTSTGLAVTGALTTNGLATSPFTMKNRIINGDMVVNQRSPGTVTLDTNTRFIVDRFFAENDSTATVTGVQSTTAPAGFINSMLFTVTTADSSITASENCTIRHWIEGLNVSDLGWGTANAQTVTLSFWVRSSVTGTHSGSLLNSAQNRSYVFSYTISAADTWEQKSITIPGDTSGTWLTTNGRGIGIYWNLGSGSNFLGTAGSWGSSLLLGSTGSVQLFSTLNATFFITGVQLERGSTATAFEWLPFGLELALCRRYYQKLNAGGVAFTSYGSGYTFSSTGMTISSTLNPVMRTTPTAAASGSNRIVTHAGSYAVTSFGGITGGTDTFYMTFQSAGTFSAATPGFVGPNGDTTASINLDAEL
jgi:hypothetical protein